MTSKQTQHGNTFKTRAVPKNTQPYSLFRQQIGRLMQVLNPLLKWSLKTEYYTLV